MIGNVWMNEKFHFVSQNLKRIIHFLLFASYRSSRLTLRCYCILRIGKHLYETFFTFLILNFPNNIFDDWQCSNKGKISFRELFTSFHKKRYKTFSLLNFPNNIMIGNVRTNEKISLGELFASYRSMRLTLLSHSSNEEKGIKRFHFSHSKFSNPNNIMIGNVRANEEISLGELFASFYSLRIDRSMRMTSVELTYTSLLLCLSCATNGGKGAVYETFPRRKRAVIAHVREIRPMSGCRPIRWTTASQRFAVEKRSDPPPLFSTQQFLPPTFFLSIVDNNLAIFDQLSSFFFHFQKERFKF